MKYRFSTLDILVLTPELNERCKSLRVSNVYNVNNKTYLLKLSKHANDGEKEEDEDKNKNFLLLESGTRIHLTDYEWPKDTIPNSFAMKLRKHIKNKRIEYINQLGIDRILDIQFGINDAAYHLILEVYDRGNIYITDCKYIILNALRPRKDGENEDVKFLVKERYPLEKFNNTKIETLNKIQIKEIIDNAKSGDNLKKIFTNYFYGPALLEHCFIENDLNPNLKLTQDKSVDLDKLLNSFKTLESVLSKSMNSKEGFIIQKEEDNALNDENKKKIISFIDYNPINFNQYKNLHEKNQQIVKYDSFNKAIDVYFSSIEGQKIDQRIYQKEKDAFKKIDNIKKDHEKRLQTLEEKQKQDQHKAYLIEINNELVEKALFILRSALSRQMSWLDIKQMLKEAQDAGDLVANRICSLKFDTNEFTILLDDPYEQKTQQQNDNVEQQQKSINNKKNKTEQQKKSNQIKVDISLDLSAHGNARKYFQEKKQAKIKEDKTLEASSKALKNAEVRTAKALKEVKIKSSIIRSRKVLWFEKFFWFISSENYIVIGGRDAQQNEMIVKRYLGQNDLYVHADLHGASSVVIKNMSSKKKIPAKTIEEAGCFAVCYSSAWEAKTPVRAWYVNADQGKTAPSGEYLGLGSFMIRGKKNYLPLPQLAMGFCFFFRLNEDSIINHINDRKVKYELIDEEETDVNLDNKDDDLTSSSFPDTKIRLTNKDNNEENHILEAMRPKVKAQKKLRKQDKKSLSESNDKQQNQQNQQKSNDKQLKNNKKGKNKKNKKDGDWSDDEEDKIKIKLEKKMQKDTRIMNLDEQIKIVNLNDYLEDEEELIDNEEENNVDEEKNNDETMNNQQIESSNNENIDSDVLKTESNTLNNENNKSTDDEDEEKDIIDHEEEDDEGNKVETNDETRESEYLKLVNSLTGQPLPDDSLMYCIPVVAPYSAIMNCKYKVKVLPGTNKRGRSAKTALNLFLTQTKSSTNERDLIKTMKDQEIARNLPSNIKLAAQNLQQVKRKK